MGSIDIDKAIKFLEDAKEIGLTLSWKDLIVQENKQLVKEEIHMDCAYMYLNQSPKWNLVTAADDFSSWTFNRACRSRESDVNDGDTVSKINSECYTIRLWHYGFFSAKIESEIYRNDMEVVTQLKVLGR